MWGRSRKSKKVFLVLVGLYLTSALLEAIFSTGWIGSLAVPLSFALVVAGMVWGLVAYSSRRGVRKKELKRKLDEIDERLGISNQADNKKTSASAPLPPVNPATPYLPQKTKLNLALGCVAIPTSLALFVGLVSAVGDISDEQSAVVSTETPSEEPIVVEAKYFGSKIVPLFVGYSAESAVRMLESEFEERFQSITNAESGERLSTYYSRERDYEELDGLFVCDQSIGAGVEFSRNWEVGRIVLEVSEECAGIEPSFVVGAAAEFLGRYLPPPLSLTDCNSSAESCEVRALDGVLIDFLDYGSRGHKTALVDTVYGEMELELAMIDLASEWCSIDEQNESEMSRKALSLRDELLPNGSLIRMVGGDALYGKRRIVHLLDEEGNLVNGEIPINSINEILVSSGYWVPNSDTARHPWESVWTNDVNKVAQWEVYAYSTYFGDAEGEQLMSEYANRISKAANDAFDAPNTLLAGCLQDKESEIALLVSDDDDSKDDDRDRIIVPSTSDDDSWALDCEGDAYYDWPQLCDGGERLLRETLAGEGPYGDWGSPGDGSSAGSGDSGGGSNCTWVDSYYRKDGTRVSGHWRCR